MSLMIWSMEQVTKLNEWQACDHVHQFTCGRRDDHPVVNGERGVLVATRYGWICPYCDYTQDWAHDFMFAGPPPAPVFNQGESQSGNA